MPVSQLTAKDLKDIVANPMIDGRHVQQQNNS